MVDRIEVFIHMDVAERDSEGATQKYCIHDM